MGDEYDTENILLAGQISNKLPVFKDIAQMDKDSALSWVVIDRWPEIKKMKARDRVKEIIRLHGQVNFMSNCSELSKLAAIMGDTRHRKSARGLKEALAIARNK